MFKSKMMVFHTHWLKSISELHKDVEGLYEWLQVLEHHEPSSLSSSDIQDRFKSLLVKYEIFKDQHSYMPPSKNSTEALEEVTNLITSLQGKFNESSQSVNINYQTMYSKISIEDIVQRAVFTNQDVNKVLSLPYDNFIEQISNQPLEAKQYAYLAIVRNFLQELKMGRIYSFKYQSELAGILDSIPGFLADNFNEFDDDYFWCDIFNRRNEAVSYVVKTFIAGLIGYYAWVKRTQLI